MPRYYFDTHFGEQHFHDDEGSELPDVQAARDEAIAVLPEIAWGELPDGDRREMTLMVRNEAGQVFFKTTLLLTAEWIGTDGAARLTR